MAGWSFWIDVGGTFTDGVVTRPEGEQMILKVLSSGAVKATAREHTATSVLVPALAGDRDDLWADYKLTSFSDVGDAIAMTSVIASTLDGRLTLADAVPDHASPRFELSSGEEAPVLLIRLALGLRLNEPIPPVTVRLGTTRGTNALLTRRGAKTGFLTTRGFRDVLLIANQDRPRLFDLAIRKPEPLFHAVAEIDERLDAHGGVLRPPQPNQVCAALRELKDAGCESLAICLLHAYANPVHEDLVVELAREAGFTQVSLSSRLSPVIKIVSRGDTTVMDAYLNPVLRDYVERLQARLPGSDVRFMTSSGGLVTAERFTGKESVLSGPAGGVIGCARLAQECSPHAPREDLLKSVPQQTHLATRALISRSEMAALKIIGFDMGGTSTDVSRYDGRLEYEYETVKAGVRIVTPMLAIETVAAGGGSICGFDGVKLFAGPQSAGSDPGPACYGRGGPLSVTDCNVFLGRIPADCFPFALDRAAIERRLQALCAEIAQSPFGKTYSQEELAAGFLEIADAAMARAIRKVSVAKGYDPAEYTLVPFGGAGGQHACALARSLGISRILAHPWAGVLSAYGIGHADVRRFQQQSVLHPYSEEALRRLEPRIKELADTARAEVLAEGIPADRIGAAEVSFDLRYQGVESAISVPRPSDGDYARDYAARHRQLYGYDRPGRPLEIVAVRVEVVGRSGVAPQSSHSVADAGPPQPAHPQHTAWFGGAAVTTPVFTRANLQPGHVIEGPAIIAEPTSTLVIEPGFTARLLSRGEVVIESEGSPGIAIPGSSSARRDPGIAIPGLPQDVSIDPVQLELFHHTFGSIAEQMGITLQHTSVSTNVKERLDFSCAIFDPQGGLVVNAPHIPVHLGAMSETVRCVLRDNPDLFGSAFGVRVSDFAEEEAANTTSAKPECRNPNAAVIVTNDPYRGGSHLPDVTVVTPVHDPASGALLFFTASRAHHAEIGGIVPGSVPPFSKNLGEEGVLIRNFRLVDKGNSREAELERLLQSGPYPSRAVADNLADIRAQVAANQMGARLLQDLITKRGADVVLAYMDHLQRAASAAMRRALAALADGDYRFTDHLDDGSPIAATITIQGETARIDFAGTGPVLASNLNANRAIVTAAVMYALRCLIGAPNPRLRLAERRGNVPLNASVDSQLPLNGGVLEPIEIVLPECLLNPPEHADPAQCPAMVGGNVETSQRTVDVLLGALGLAAASQGTMNNFTFGDGSFGYYETICGGSGATSDADGADAVHTHMTNTRLTDPEVLERRYPVRLREFTIRRGSGGKGQHRGGDGVLRRIEFLKPVQVSLLTERRGPFAPYGMEGGEPGQLGQNTLTRAANGETINLGGKAAFAVKAGDVLTIETPGGGGYGVPS